MTGWCIGVIGCVIFSAAVVCWTSCNAMIKPLESLFSVICFGHSQFEFDHVKNGLGCRWRRD